MKRRPPRRRSTEAFARGNRRSSATRRSTRRRSRRLFGSPNAFASSLVAWFRGLLTSTPARPKAAEQIGAARPLGHFEPLEARQLLAGVDFGNLNWTGDGDTGWIFSSSSDPAEAGFGNPGGPDSPSFYGDNTAQLVGTSDGDALAAGDYTIDFKHASIFDAAPTNFTVGAFAWNGSTETSLGPATTVPLTATWSTGSHSFTINVGSSAIGQDLRLKFTGPASGAATTGYWGFDTITGDVQLVGGGAPEINVNDGPSVSDTDIADGGAAANFGSQSVAAGFIDRTFNIDNAAGTATLNISSASFSGGAAGDFSFVGAVPPSIAAGSSDTVTVRFDPSAAGALSTTLQIVSDDADEATYDITLNGTGTVAPAATPAPITSVTSTTTGTDGGDPPAVGDQTIVLDTITVGSTVYTTNSMVTGISSGNVGSGTITDMDNFDINSQFSPSNPGTWDTLFAGVNLVGADFFIFEGGGNDALSVKPIFTNDTTGNSLTLTTSSAGAGYNWGDTGLTITEGARDGQNAFGLTFSYGDLLNGSGGNLTTEVIKGLEFTGAGIDPASISAVVPAAQAQWTESVFVNPGTANTTMGNWDIDVSNGIGIAAPNDKSGTFADKPILFNTADGTLLRRLNPTTAFSGGNVMGAAIDGGLAVVGEQGNQFVLFDVATGNELGRVANTFGNSGFGSSAAISGTTVAIGGWDGKVRVFDVSPLVDSTGPATLLGDVPSSGNFAFALSGNTLVSAQGGTVNVYTVGATSIGAGTSLTTPATAGAFGTSVDIDGNMVIVGADGDYAGTTSAGSAYLFDLSVSPTESQATIAPAVPYEQRRFGYDVGISGDTVIVASGMRYAGTTDYSEDGEAYLFDITNPAAITQIQKMGSGNTVGEDRYGYEGGVAIDGDYAVVSASNYDIPSGNSNVGAAYIYTAPPAAQAAYTWIGGVSTTWNTTDANWDDGGGATTWVNGNDAVFKGADFQNPFTAVTIAAGITANSVLTEGSIYGYPELLKGSPLTLIGDATWTANDSQAYMRAGLAGTAGLTKLGDNTLRLDRIPVTYTGDTTISAGTLRFNRDAPLGNGTYAGNISIASGATLSYERGVQTFNGVISGTGSFLATDGGSGYAMTLGGVNTFTGELKVGTILTLSSTGSLLFDIDGDGVNNQIDYLGSGAGDLNLEGAFAFDLSGADTTLTNTWQIVDVALDTTYDSGFSVTGFTEVADVWTMESGGVNFVFTESTGVLSLSPANATPAPITSLVGTTATSPPNGPITFDSFTVGTVTYNTTDLVTGTSVVTDTFGNPGVIGNQDNLDLNTLFSRGNNPSDHAWNTTSFGGENWYDTNGDDADFFIFEARGNDTLNVAPIFTDDTVGQYVEIVAGGGTNWGDTGVTVTGPIRTGDTIFGVGFAITDLKDAGGDALTNSTEIKGLAFDAFGIDIASISAVAVPATAAPIILGDTSTASADGGGGTEDNLANDDGLTGSGATATFSRPYSNGVRLTNPGWARIDLGDTYTVDTMYVWNYNEDDGGGRGTKDANIYYSTVANADASNFASGDWTLLGSETLSPNVWPQEAVNDIIDLGGVTARIIGIETLNNHDGFSQFTGLGKLQFSGTLVPAIGDPPVAVDDILTEISEDAGATDITGMVGVANSGVLGNDSDPNSDSLTFAAIDDSAITAGTLALEAGVLTYDPNGGFESLAAGETATQTFAYTISDGNGNEATATATITITGENDAPVIAPAALIPLTGASSTAGAAASGTPASKVTDGIGMAGELATGTHTGSISDDAWFNGGPADEWFKVDLGGLYDVEKMYVWNGQPGFGVWDRGVGSADIYYSTNVNATGASIPTNGASSGDWILITSETFNQKPSDTADYGPTDDFDLDVTARVIGLDLTQGFGGNGGNSLAELQFTGTLASETTVLTETNDPLAISGTLAVTDVDTTDEVSAAVDSVAVTGIDNGIPNATLEAMMTVATNPVIANGATTGTINWDFDSGSETFDYLADGESIELTYTISATDDSAAPIIITDNVEAVSDYTYFGSSLSNYDSPSGDFGVPSQAGPRFMSTSIGNKTSRSGTFTFTPGGANTGFPGETIQAGTYAFTMSVGDADSARSGFTTWSHRLQTTAGFLGTAVGLNGATELPGGVVTTPFVALPNDGSAQWTTTTITYTVPAGDALIGNQFTWAADYTYVGPTAGLQGAWDAVSIEFTAIPEPSEPDSDTQTVVVTIEGTNDQPNITLVGTDSAAETITETDAANLSTDGTLSVEDLDVTDVVSTAVDSVAVTSGVDNGITNAALLAMMDVDLTPGIGSTNTTGTINWDFDSGSETFDYLADGESIELTYTISATDDSGAEAAIILDGVTQSDPLTTTGVKTINGVNTVDGGSVWTHNDDLLKIGNRTTGSLTVSGGGVLNITPETVPDTYAFQVGNQGGGIAQALVTGTGSKVTTLTPIQVGRNSSGSTLTIEDGGLVVGQDVVLGRDSGSGFLRMRTGGALAIEGAGKTLLSQMHTVQGGGELQYWNGSAWAELTDAVLASDSDITLADGTGDLAGYTVLTVGVATVTEPDSDTQTVVVTITGTNDAPEIVDGISVLNTGSQVVVAPDPKISTLSFDAGANADKVVVQVSGEVSGGAILVTYNGVALTQAAGTANGRNLGIWYLDDPYTGGAADLTVDMTAKTTVNGIAFGVVSISGSAPGVAAAASGSENSVTISPTDDGSFVMVGFGAQGGGGGGAVDASLTQLYGGVNIGSAEGAAGYGTGVTTAPVTYSFSGGNDPKGAGAAAFAPATVLTGVVTEDTSVVSGNLSDTGTIEFTDVDLTDTHTTSVTADAGNAVGGTLTMGAVSESSTTAEGAVDWTYEVANSATQRLAAGQSETESFTVEISDAHGGTDTTTVTVTINGTNDAPEISVSALPAADGTTIATVSSAPTVDHADIAQLSGTSDPGGNLGHVWSNRPIHGQTFTTGDNAAGYDLSSVSLRGSNQGNTGAWTVRIGTLDGSHNFTALATKTGSGVNKNQDWITWTFDTPMTLAPNTEYAFDVDTAGGGFVSHYNNTTPDSYAGGTAFSSGGGGVPANPVTRHTFDRTFHVDLVARSDSASLDETDAGLTASGALTVSDVDTSNTAGVSVESVTIDAASTGTTSVINDDLKAMLDLSPITPVSNTSQMGTFAWTFDSNGEVFDNLSDGETLILVYTVEAEDDAGTPLSDTHAVTVTITGSNDPVTANDDGAEINETMGPEPTSPPNTVSGTAIGSPHGTGTNTPFDQNGYQDVADTDIDTNDTLTVQDAVSVFTAGAPVAPGTAVVGEFGNLAVEADGDYTYTLGVTPTQEAALNLVNTGTDVTDTFTLTITDSQGGTDPSDVVITIHGATDNDAPEITSPAEGEVMVVEVGGTLSVSGAFTDDDTGDTHTVTIGWGGTEGQDVTTLTPVGERVFSDDHTYNTAGEYAASVTVSDTIDDDTHNFTVYVGNTLVEIDGSVVTVTDLVGKVDNLQVAVVGTDLVLTDPGNTLILVGGTVVQGGSSVTIPLAGLTQLDIDLATEDDTLDLSALTSPITVTLTGLGGSDGYQGTFTGTGLTSSFDNVDNVVAPAATDGDQLIGADRDTDWSLAATEPHGLADVATPTRTLGFSGFESLAGGSADDQFTLAADMTFPGAIDGGAHGDQGDTLNLSAYAADLDISLADARFEAGGSAIFTGGVAVGDGTTDVGSSIENVLGGGGGDLITGDDDDNVLGDGLGTDTLAGGLGDDRFMLQLGAGDSGNPDQVYDAANPVAGVVDQDTLDFSWFVSGTGEGVTIDMDLLDVAQEVSTGHWLQLNAELPAPAPSAYENFTGSVEADTVTIDPLAGIPRHVDGNDPTTLPGDTIHFEADGNTVIDTGNSLTATGVGTVSYENIETFDTPNSAPVIIDNGDVGWRYTGAFRDISDQGYDGDVHYKLRASGSDVASWTIDGLSPGQYVVSLTWTKGIGTDRDPAASVTILDGSTPIGSPLTINQQLSPTQAQASLARHFSYTVGGRPWRDLGVYDVTGNSLTVQLRGSRQNFLIADAVRVERVGMDGSAVRVLGADGSLLVDGSGLSDFGSTPLQLPVEQTYTIQNIGTGDVRLADLQLPIGYSPSASAALPAVVAKDGSAEFGVVLDAATAGTFSGELAFAYGSPSAPHGADDGIYDYSLTGTVTEEVVTPENPMAAQVIDDRDAGFSTTRFRHATNDGRFYLSDYSYEVPGGRNTATYEFTGLQAGATYRVSGTWYAWPNRSTVTPFTIKNGDVQQTVRINQRISPDAHTSSFLDEQGWAWADIHSGFVASSNGELVIEMTGAPDGYVIADAVRVQQVVGTEIALFEVIDSGSAEQFVELFDGRSEVQFGFTEQGNALQKTFEIRNVGADDLTFNPTSLTLPGGFSLVDSTYNPAATEVTIAAGGDPQRFTVQLDAVVPGALTGVISLGNSDPDENPFDIAVGGTVGKKIIDNDDAGFEGGAFRLVASDPRFYLNDYRYTPPGGTAEATWTFSGLVPGKTYQMSGTWFAWPNRATDATYVFRSGGEIVGTGTVNQRLAPDDFSDEGVYWEELADVTAAGDGTITVTLSSSDTGYAIADGVRLESLYLPEVQVQLEEPDEPLLLVTSGDTVDFGTALQFSTMPEKQFLLTNNGEQPLYLGGLESSLDTYFLIVDDDVNDDVDHFGVWDDALNDYRWEETLWLAPGDQARIWVGQNTSTITLAGPVFSQISFDTSDVSEREFVFDVTGAVEGNYRVIDNDATGFYPGTFRLVANDSRFYENDYRYQLPGKKSRATWTFSGLEEGWYRVSATWFAWPNRPTDVEYSVHIGAATNLRELSDFVNQRLDPIGGPDLYFQTLIDDASAESAVYVPADETLVVALNTWGDTNGYAIADAVRVDWAADKNPGSPLHAADVGQASAFGAGQTFGAGLLTRPVARTEGLHGTSGDLTVAAGGSVGRPATTSALTTASVQDALSQAVAQWQSTGLTAAELAQLSNVQVQGASLPGTMLGYASATEPTIYVDFDAAGHGWTLEGQRTKAKGHSIGSGMDLVSALAHELGHVLGHEHDDGDSLMSATLGVGGQSSGIRSQESGVRSPATADLRQESGIRDQWSAFGDFGESDLASRISHPASRITQPASRTSHPASRITDALFARLDDRAGAMTDDYDSLIDEDGSSEEAEDGLDLWGMLF